MIETPDIERPDRALVVSLGYDTVAGDPMQALHRVCRDRVDLLAAPHHD